MRKQTKNQEILKIPLHKIVVDGTQPRKHFDKQTLDEIKAVALTEQVKMVINGLQVWLKELAAEGTT